MKPRKPQKASFHGAQIREAFVLTTRQVFAVITECITSFWRRRRRYLYSLAPHPYQFHQAV